MPFVADLTAAHEYLDRAAAYPATFEGTQRAQFDQVKALLGRVQLNTSEGTSVLDALQQARCWSDEQKVDLVAAVQARVAAAPPPHVRQGLQDYSSMALFFTSDLWSELMKPENSDYARCNLIANFCGNMGLRNPTETTLQFLTSLLLHLPGCKLASSTPMDLHNSFVYVKQLVKAQVASLGPVPSGYPWMERLPSSWHGLDARWIDLAYGPLQPSRDVPINISSIGAAALSIPMRKSNRALNAKQSFFASGSSNSNLVNELLERLQISSAPAASGLRGFRMLVPESQPEPVCLPTRSGTFSDSDGPATKPLAIKITSDAETAMPMECIGNEGMSKPKPLAIAGPDRLDDVEPATDAASLTTASKQPSDEDVSKNAACAVSAAALLKQELEATKSAKIQPQKKESPKKSKATAKKQVSKTKAIPTNTKKGGRGSANVKADRAQRLAAGISPSLLKRFEKGCPTCRHRPLCCASCWKKRGFEI